MADIHLLRDNRNPDSWRVEDTDADGDGACAVTIFAGYQAEQRARQYADWLRTAELVRGGQRS